MKALVLVFAVLVAGLLVPAAAARTTAEDSGGITGTVTDIGESEVLIEEDPNERFGSDKSYVRITPNTRIRKESGGKNAAARFEDLAVGGRVEARFSGPVAESYPTQATAASVVVLDGKSANLPGTGGPSPGLLWSGVALVVLAAGVACGRLLRRSWPGLRLG